MAKLVHSITRMHTRVLWSETKSTLSTMALSRRTRQPVCHSIVRLSRPGSMQDPKWAMVRRISRARRSTLSLCQQAITLARSHHVRQVKCSRPPEYQSKTKFTCLVASKPLTTRCTQVWRPTVLSTFTTLTCLTRCYRRTKASI